MEFDIKIMDMTTDTIKKKPNKITVLVSISFAITFIATVLRVLSVLFFFDKDISYYSVDALLPVVSDFFCALGAVFFAVVSTFLITEKSEVVPPHTISRFASAIPGGMVLFYALVRAGELFMGDPHAKPLALEIILFLASTLAVIFFFSILFSNQPSTVSINAGVGMIIWLALRWISSYTDFNVPMNSPLKLFFHFGCIGAALLIVAEMRAFLGIEKPKFYFFSLFGSILCLSISCIPAMVGYFTESFEVYPFINEDFVLLGMLVYAIVRAIELLVHKRNAEKEEEAAIAEATATEANAEEAPAEDSVAEETVAEETAAEETADEEATAEEAETEEITEEAPVEESAEETPAEETAAE